jgi:predicted nucleic acid-binding protein
VIVVDASALLEALLRTPAASAVEDRLFAPHQTLHAPHLLDLEVAQLFDDMPQMAKPIARAAARPSPIWRTFRCGGIRTISFCRAFGICGTI